MRWIERGKKGGREDIKSKRKKGERRETNSAKEGVWSREKQKLRVRG